MQGVPAPVSPQVFMSVEFVIGATSPDLFPSDGLPEIAFVGRSNVGKSSLLNTLLLRGKKKGAPIVKKDLARTSSTPGRTQTINFFRVDDKMYFVDLPGYGYAKAPKQVVDQWRYLAESYLTDRAPLKLVVLIVDIRHGPTPLDRAMMDWLQENQQRFVLVASKADKLKTAQRLKAVRAIEQDFYPPLAFSSVTGDGVAALWDGIRAAPDL
jgi:GTP-binding protein